MSPEPSFEARVRGFEEAILEDSGDLAIWLIFADFLDDHSHPRAEVTRLWAKNRWDDSPLAPQEADRLQALLDDGLRPHLPRRTNSIGMETVLVPKGTFWMSQDGYHAQREVTIPHDFFIGIYPVTQGQWRALMGDNPSGFSRDGEQSADVEGIPDEELSLFPVDSVSLADCEAFLAKLNESNQKEAWSHRLPTEAEWEYACRAAATSKEECGYHFYLSQATNHLSSNQANFDGNHPEGGAAEGPNLRRTNKVGSHESNVLGVYDMHANLWEWCQTRSDAFDNYRQIIRGGGWVSYAQHCRASNHHSHPTDARDDDLGFRVVLVPSTEPD